MYHINTCIYYIFLGEYKNYTNPFLNSNSLREKRDLCFLSYNLLICLTFSLCYIWPKKRNLPFKIGPLGYYVD